MKFAVVLFVSGVLCTACGASIGTESLRDWMATAFEKLPCFDRTTASSTGPGMFIHGARGDYHLARGRPGNEAEYVGALSWQQFSDTLHTWARVLERQMSVDARWVHRTPGYGNMNVTDILRDSHFFDLRARKAVRPAGTWGGPARRNGEPQFPFVQRLLVPARSVIAVFGDLHGSVHSLLRELSALVDRGYLLDNWQVAPEWAGRFYVMFLGDYVDRGMHGVEVLYTMMRLKIENPDSVFMSRGNHEDLVLNMPNLGGTFVRELQQKFPNEARVAMIREVTRIYDLMPWALFVGTKNDTSTTGHRPYILACHGGIEVGYDPQPLLRRPVTARGAAEPDLQFAPVLSLLRRQWLHAAPPHIQDPVRRRFEGVFHDYQSNIPETCATGAQKGNPCEEEGDAAWAVPTGSTGGESFPTVPTGTDPAIGFLWSDFFVDDNKTVMEVTPGRGPIYGKAFTEYWLQHAGVKAILRAHQHNDNPLAGPMLSRLRRQAGMVNSWSDAGLVYTFLSGTECPGFNFHHDSFGLLHFAEEDPASWRLHHCHHEVGVQAVKVGPSWREGFPWNAHARFNQATVGDENDNDMDEETGGLDQEMSVDWEEWTMSRLEEDNEADGTGSVQWERLNSAPGLESPLDAMDSEADDPNFKDRSSDAEEIVRAWTSPGLPSRRERFLLHRYTPDVEHACDITHRFVCDPVSWRGNPPRMAREVVDTIGRSARRQLVEEYGEKAQQTTSNASEREENDEQKEKVVSCPVQLRIETPAQGSMLRLQPVGPNATAAVPVVVRGTACHDDEEDFDPNREVTISLWKLREAAVLASADSIARPLVGDNFPDAVLQEVLRHSSHMALARAVSSGAAGPSRCWEMQESVTVHHVSDGVYALVVTDTAGSGDDDDLCGDSLVFSAAIA